MRLTEKRPRETKADTGRASYQPETFPKIKSAQRGYASADSYPSAHLHQWINEQTDQALAERDASLRALEGGGAPPFNRTAASRMGADKVSSSKAWLAYPHLRDPNSSPRNSIQPGQPSDLATAGPDADLEEEEFIAFPQPLRSSRLKSFISKCTFNLLDIPATSTDRRRASFSQHPSPPPPQHPEPSTSSKRGVSLDIRPAERWRPSVIHHFNTPNQSGSTPITVDNWPPPRKSTSSYTTDPSSFRGPVSSENYFGTRKSAFRRSVWADSSTASNTTDSGTTDVSLTEGPAKWSNRLADTAVPPGRKSMSSLLKTDIVPSVVRQAPATLQKPNRPPPKTTKMPKTYTPSRISLSALSRDKKKKKLVINGIGVEETKRAAAMRKWCEEFGEISYFGRMNSGDIQVIFVKTEVADTVCRLRASVRIVGVGSVNLSWYTGDLKH